MSGAIGVRRAAFVAACGAVTVVLAAGCGGNGSGAGAYNGGQQSAGPTQVSSTPNRPGAASTAASGSAGQAEGATVTATEKDFSIQLSRQAFTAGTYTFVAENAGRFPHALEIEGNGLTEKKTGVLQPGGKSMLAVTLKKGTYELYCPVDGHKDKGMKLEIIVG